MTDVDTHERTRPGVSRWLPPALAVLAMIVTAVAIPLKIAEDKYGPIDDGSFGMFATSGPGIALDSDGSDNDRHLVEHATGPAYVYLTMGNAGSHSVLVTGFDRDDVITGAQWGEFPDDQTTVVPTGVRYRPFPALVPPNTDVFIRVTIHRPKSCDTRPADPNSGVDFSGDLRVHWESLLRDHTTTLHGMYGPDTTMIKIC